MLVFLLNSCKPEKRVHPNKDIKEQKVIKNDTAATVYKDYTRAPVDFLAEKYKANGYVLPDNHPSFPAYTFFDQNLGAFTVNYVGKSMLIQDNWNIDNSTGFFAQFKNIDIQEGNSKLIKERVKQVLKRELNDYYIVADFLPKEAILKYYDDGSGDFELKKDAYTYFYVYENKEWVFIKRLLTGKIKKDGVMLFNELLLFHKLKNIKPIAQEFQGKFTASVQGEYTENGTGSTTYYFTITKNKIDLKSEAFMGDFVCEGEYKGIQDGNILELYYDREDERCINLKPTYLIKKEDDTYFIKGIGGEGTINDWIKLDEGFKA